MKGLTKSFGIVEVSHLQFMDNNIFFLSENRGIIS